jgi:hypothetical protein
VKEAAEEAAMKKAAEEAATKKAVEERAAKVATAKAATAKAAGAARGSSAPGQAPSAAGAKRTMAPSDSTPASQTSLHGCLETLICPDLSPFFFFFCFILLLPFLSRSSPSGVAAVTGAAAVHAVVWAAPGPASISEPRTPEGVSKDVVESEGEPEAAPEVVQEEAPAEGAMIVVRMAAAPPLSRGAHAPLSSVPRRAAASGAAVGEGMEVVLGHPTPYAPGNISVSEAVSTAHQALSQAQHVLHHKGEDLADECRHLQLWASMLKRMTMSERGTARAWQHGFDLQVEAIVQRDADSQRALADA